MAHDDFEPASEPEAPEPTADSGPWTRGGAADAPAEPEQPKANPWGRNPTGQRGLGPKGPWS